MSKKEISIYISGILGFLILIISYYMSEKPPGAVVAVCAALSAGSIAGIVSNFLTPWLIGKLWPTWDYLNIRKAPSKFAACLKNKTIEELKVSAYSMQVAYRIFENLSEKNCFAKKVKILIRDPNEMINDILETKSTCIPQQLSTVSARVEEMHRTVVSNILAMREGINKITKDSDDIQIGLYPGQPSLRIVIAEIYKQDLDNLEVRKSDKSMGYFSIYIKKNPKNDSGIIDWSASHSSALRLSHKQIYEQKILIDAQKWFNMTWNNSAIITTHSEFKEILENCKYRISIERNKATGY